MMTKNLLYRTLRLRAMLIAAVGLAVAVSGCVKDAPQADPRFPGAGALSFRADLGSGTLATRFGEVIPVVPADFGEEIFYIYERGTALDQNDNSATPYMRTSVRPYWLASGSQGELEVASAALFEDWSQQYLGQGASQVDKKKWELNWFSSGTDHDFWSWTWPLEKLDYSDVKYDEKSDSDEPTPDRAGLPLTFISSDFPLPNYDAETASGETRSIATRGDGDPEESGGDETPGTDPVDPARTWRNGEALERLVGTKTDRSYVFNQDGRYVPLTYKHLVSKIILGDFWLYDNTGATQKDLKALITFYGMPKRAMFYPYPAPVEGVVPAPYVTIDHSDPYGISKNPKVKTPEADATRDKVTYDPDQFLTFYIMNEGNHEDNSGGLILADDYYRDHDAFYICPEIDFSNLEYKVEFYEAIVDKETNRVLGYQRHQRYGVRGGYFGDFKNVEFRREIGTDENGNPIYDEDPSDDHVLHAGEVMILNMKVYEKSGPGVGVWIRNWSSENLKSATYHKHPGIYSGADATAVRDAYWYTSPNGTYDGRKERASELYGETVKDEETGKETTVIRMYSDITFACYNSNVTAEDHYQFRLRPEKDKDVILDGMGYTISFVEQYAAHTEPHESFYIGNVRDVYVTNGETTIYFDDQGNICRLNKETGKYEPTGESWTPNTTAIYFEKKD